MFEVFALCGVDRRDVADYARLGLPVLTAFSFENRPHLCALLCVFLEDAEQSLATIAGDRDGVPPIHGVLIR